jgi:hypothetical protein
LAQIETMKRQVAKNRQYRFGSNSNLEGESFGWVVKNGETEMTEYCLFDLCCVLKVFVWCVVIERDLALVLAMGLSNALIQWKHTKNAVWPFLHHAHF